MQSLFKLSLSRLLKWFFVWSVAIAILIWRIVDHIDEALHDDFHATRGGLAIFNNQAEIFQLLIIVVCLALAWVATYKLLYHIKILIKSTHKSST